MGQIGNRKFIKLEAKMGINKTSQKYEGVRSKEFNNGDIAYYARWSDKDDNRFEKKVSTKAGGWSEKKPQ